MNNPLRGGLRPYVCHGTAFPLAILAWVICFIIPRSGDQPPGQPVSELTTPVIASSGHSYLQSRAVCFPLFVSGAARHCGTRTAGSTRPLSGAERVYSLTSVTNCNHHERSRAESACFYSERTCAGTPSLPLPRGAAPVPLYTQTQQNKARISESIAHQRAGWTGP